MFFGNEKINRKSCSEEKKVRGKIVYFYGLESGLGNARRKLLGLRADLQVGGRGFRKFLQIFPEFFWNFLQFFWKISTIFWKISTIFWKISPKFLQFFFNLCDFLTIFPKILAHNPLQFNRGLAIIVSLQVSLQVGLHLSLHLYL